MAASWFAYLTLYGNFHQVDKSFYRSAQLFGFNMPHYLEKYAIHTVINLRGKRPEKAWYRDELHYCQEHNISHYDIKLDAKKQPSLSQMDALVKLMRKAKKPILVHCRMGADRTSLATALYLFDHNRTKEAYDAISILYGHFPWLGSKTVAMDRAFESYVKAKRREATDQ